MTSTALDPALLAELSNVVRARTGLHFAPNAWPQLSKAVAEAAAELKLDSALSFATRLISGSAGQDMIDLLARHLTIGETYFFREPAALRVFAEQMLPGLIAERRHTTRHLRIWSAACCTGEEPYTLAMILRGLLTERHTWNVSILATDINRDYLARAAEGVYREWSFRAMPEQKRDAYFTRNVTTGTYTLRPEIKELVSFGYLNLAGTDYPSPLTNTNNLDVIFCRNVLIYFSPEMAAHVARRFYNSLADGGWLVVSPSEASSALFADFEMLTYPGAIIYRKPRLSNAEPARQARQEAARQMPIASKAASRGTAPLTPTRPAQAATTTRPRLQSQRQSKPAPAPNDAANAVSQARAAADLGKLDEALNWVRAALDADKVEPRYHYLYASILLEAGRPDEAQVALRRVLFLDHNFVAAYFALGNLAARAGRTAEARKHLGTVRTLLARIADDEQIPELDGLTAGRLSLMVAGIIAGLGKGGGR